VSHLDGESKLFVFRTSAAVAQAYNIEFKSTALPKACKENAVPLESGTREYCVVFAKQRGAWRVMRGAREIRRGG
jgi:hypothetical protein